MGIIVNHTKHIATNLEKGAVPEGSFTLVKKGEVMNALGKNSSSSLELGAKTCPLVSECGDFHIGAINTGLLLLYALSNGTQSKVIALN